MLDDDEDDEEDEDDDEEDEDDDDGMTTVDARRVFVPLSFRPSRSFKKEALALELGWPCSGLSIAGGCGGSTGSAMTTTAQFTSFNSLKLPTLA